MLEGRPDQAGLQQRLAHRVKLVEQIPVKHAEVHAGSQLDATIEHILRLLDFLAEPHVAVFDAAAPVQIEEAVDALQRHGDPLEAVGQLGGHRRQLHAACLLEVRKLRNLEAVEQHLPADAPGAERRRFPVVLLETNVVLARVDTARLQALEIQLLHIVGRRLENDLELVVLEEAIRILAEAAVGGPPRRLYIGDVPMRGSEHPQKRFRVHRAGANLYVERLLKRAPARGPEFGKLENQVLKRHRRISLNTFVDRSSLSRCTAIIVRCDISSSRSAFGDAVCAVSANGLQVRAARRNACASSDAFGSG